MTLDLSIRRPGPGDREAWGRLYSAYAGFYGVAQTDQMRERVWSWIEDSSHEVDGLVAERGGALIGLAHFRAFSRPLAATSAGFLDDLFVDPGTRGLGVAKALIGAVASEGEKRGWSLVRWLTAEDNYRARSVYDSLAEPTKWKVYDLKLS